MSDESFRAQLTHGNDFLSSERMIGSDNQSQFVPGDGHGRDRLIARFERDDANLHVAAENLCRNPAGQTALHFDFYVRVARAKDWNQRQKAHHRVFVRAER